MKIITFMNFAYSQDYEILWKRFKWRTNTNDSQIDFIRTYEKLYIINNEYYIKNYYTIISIILLKYLMKQIKYHWK